MTREDFTKSILINERRNFVIYTNIAVGQGINGVDYKVFTGYKEWDGNYNNNYYMSTKIVGLLGNSVVLDLDNNSDNSWENGKRRIILPLDNVVALELRYDRREGRLRIPMVLAKGKESSVKDLGHVSDKF